MQTSHGLQAPKQWLSWLEFLPWGCHFYSVHTHTPDISTNWSYYSFCFIYSQSWGNFKPHWCPAGRNFDGNVW